MAQVVRAAVGTALIHRQLINLLSLQTPIITTTKGTVIAAPHLLWHHRNGHLQPRALRPQRELELEKDKWNNKKRREKEEKEDNNENNNKRRSRSEMKREARQALHWGMDLASFTIPQIKLILKAAALEEEVFEALMLVKRLGSDVREGKRRQFNYIAKLLRDADAQPDLLGALIQATKDGDQSRLQALVGSVNLANEESEEELIEFEFESESDQEDEDSCDHVLLARKWFDGLIQKDIEISNEVYSVDSVDFDRQELRKLVRRVHSVQDSQNSGEESPEFIAAKKSLNRFLCSLAKRHSSALNLNVLV